MPPSYLDFDEEPELNTADPPVGAPEGGYKGKHVNDTFRYVMAVIRSLGDAVPKLAAGMSAAAEIGLLALKNTVASADIDSSAVTESKISSGAVTETKLGSGAVTNAKLGALAVTESKLTDGAVTADKIGSAAVTEAKLGTGAVTETKLASNAVTGTKIAFGSITSTKIAASAVVEAALANDAVTTTKIANAQVTKLKLESNVVSALAKGWVKFSVAGAEQASFNVSSVTGSDGDYTVNWNTDFGDAHYAVAAMILQDGTAGGARIAEARAQTSGTTRIRILNGDGTVSFGGVQSVYVIAFGDQ